MKKPYRDYQYPKRHSGSNFTHVIYGIHAVKAALHNSLRNCKMLYIDQKYAKEFVPLAHHAGTEHQIVSGQWFTTQIGNEEHLHQKIALIADPLKVEDGELYLEQCKNILLLDGVTDPRNIGALIRSAAAFGFEAIVQKRSGFVGENPMMAKAASGAIEHIRIGAVTNLARFIEHAKKNDFWCVGLDSHNGLNINQYAWPEKVILTLGSENKGLRSNLKYKIDQLVWIKQRQYATDSLNVTVAGSIAMHARFNALH